MFLVQLKQNENLLKAFVSLKYCEDTNSYQTRAVTMKLLGTTLFKSQKYQTGSAKYNYIVDWNNFKKIFGHVPQQKYSFLLVKTLFKEHYLCNY